MERLRLTLKEKIDLIENFKEEVDKADKLSAINFDPKGYIKKIDEKNIIKPTLIIKPEVMFKMQALVDESSVEISWHGFVKRDKEKNVYFVYDIALFPQINSAATTTTDQDKYADWISQYITNPESNFEDMRLHGHSHVNMGVFSSGTDDAYQEDLIRHTEDGDYYIFLILNKKRDICALIYDFEQQILFKNNDIALKIMDKDTVDAYSWAKQMIKEYCTEELPKWKSPHNYPTEYDWNQTTYVRKGVNKR